MSKLRQRGPGGRYDNDKRLPDSLSVWRWPSVLIYLLIVELSVLVDPSLSCGAADCAGRHVWMRREQSHPFRSRAHRGDHVMRVANRHSILVISFARNVWRRC